MSEPIDDRTAWVIDRIVDLYPPGDGSTGAFEPPIAMQTIEEAIRALEGVAGLTLFGLSSTVIDDSRRAEVLQLLRDARAAWQAILDD